VTAKQINSFSSAMGKPILSGRVDEVVNIIEANVQPLDAHASVQT
jgi:hypothetical protein